MLFYFSIFILFLVLITLMGHGIWVLLQSIFRLLRSASPADSLYRCQVCNTSLQPRSNYCGFCGSRQVADEAIPADLDFIVRQLERMLSLGRIDQITYDSILRAIEEDRARFKSPERPQIEKIEKIEKTSRPPQPAAIKTAALPITAERTAHVNPPPAASIMERPMQARAARPVESKPVQVKEDFPRSFAEVLASFMEERSIQWGEVIGGLLIVGCSIALVISLWARISTYPFLKFIVFAGMTSGLFGLGFYSAHRWKLPTSSRGVLTISTMLVPLNFLAISAFSSNGLPASLPAIVGELVALALFMFFVYQAARVILPRCEWLLVCAALGPSFTMLLAQHWSPPNDAMRQSILLGILPLVCYWVSTGSVLRYFKNDSISPAHHFTLLGIATFSALQPLILLIVNNPGYTATLYSPLIAFFGVPAIVAGLANLNRPTGELSGGMRTLATSVSFMGALGPFAALALAWPIPVSLLFVALINCAICYVLVLAYRQLNPLHLLALAHLLLIYLIGVNLSAENISLWAEDAPRLLASFVSTTSAYSLVFFFSLLAVAAEELRKTESSVGEGKPEFALENYYGIAAAVVGALGLVLITYHGFGRAGDPRQAAPIYAFYSLAAFIIAWRRAIRIAAWVACALALIAVFQAMVFKYGAALSPYHPVWLSFLVGASVAALAAVSLRGERARRLFRVPLTTAALFSSAIAAVGVRFDGLLSNTEISACMLWLALIWAILAWFNRWRGLFSVFQTALALSVVSGTAAIIDDRFAHSPHPLLSIDPLRLQAQGIALALLSFAWLAVRLYLRTGDKTVDKNEEDQRAEASVLLRLLSPPWPAVDRITTAISLLLLFVLSIASLFPQMGVFEREAAGVGSWMLALVLAAVLLTGLWVRFSQIAVLALIVIFSCITMLLAGREGMPNVSTGTAFYWFASLGFLIVSLPILLRDRVSRLCESFGWPEMKERTAGLAKAARNTALILFVAPVLLTKPLLFLGKIARDESDFTALGSLASLVIPLIVISLTLAAYAIRESSTGFAVSSSIILNLAATMGGLLSVDDTLWPLRIAHLNILTTSVTALAWFTAARFRLDSERFRQGYFGGVPHQFLASLSLYLSFVVSLFHLGAIILNPGSQSGTAPSGWLALSSFLVLMAACLWDSQYKFAVPGLLLSGFLFIFLLLSDLDGEKLGIAAAILLASYGLALGIFWRRRGALAQLADGLNLPDRDGASVRGWILLAIGSIAASVISISLLSFFYGVTYRYRLIVATTALSLPIAIGLFGAGENSKRLIRSTVNLGLLSVLLWSWSWMDEGLWDRNFLIAIVILMTALIAVVKLWAMLFNSFAREWRETLRSELPALAVIGLASLTILFIISLQEFYGLQHVMMGKPATLVVLATLVLLTALSLALALLPGEDPLGLDKPGRTKKGYVYAAESFIALGLLHARITMPWLFGHFFQPFWPLVVISLAFTGVALGEWFRRRDSLIMAEPLARTGMLLPLLPVLGFWVADSQVPYSGVLLLVGLFYGILSVRRHSFLLGLLAAAAGNGGLWHILHGRDGYRFFEHPQLWLIPAALSVLAAARVNRNNLTDEQMTGIRYASLMTIYISSTADIFVNGVADSPWLSLILAVLSVAGVIVGLMLRVRAFLFMGTGFLLLAVLTMIWAASVNLGWSWLWWVTGIAFGILLVYAFAMFEQKRTRMLNLLDQLKHWEA